MVVVRTRVRVTGNTLGYVCLAGRVTHKLLLRLT